MGFRKPGFLGISSKRVFQATRISPTNKPLMGKASIVAAVAAEGTKAAIVRSIVVGLLVGKIRVA
jgi:hypothetical protein